MAQDENTTDLFWKVALDSARQGVWDYDISTGIKNHSEMWREIRGLKPGVLEAVTDEDWLDVIHPDDRELARDQTERLNAGLLAEVNYEYRERHADGHWIWIMCRGRPVAWDADGKPYRFVGTDTDISPLKASEDRIKAVSRRLELALSSVQIGIWQYDVTQDRIEWDARLRSIYGLPPDNAPLPRDVWERALHPEDLAFATKATEMALERRVDYDLSYRIIRTDGAVRFLRSRVSFQEDLIGGPVLVGINWDATDEHEHSEALKFANQLASNRNVELEAARAEMEHNALHDALTGLPNRRMLDRAHKDSRVRGGQGMKRSAILHVDLDRFKQINDVFGHSTGDFVLKNTANILRGCVDAGSLVARVGGDEFAIFVPRAPSDGDLQALAERLISRISQPLRHKGAVCRYGISVGIAVAEGTQIDGTALLVNADLALYRAKAEGRGRYCFFTDEMRAAALAQKRKSDEVLGGIERDEFFCVYQPQFDARTMAISGVEALVRWQAPHHGVLQPADFLTTAEELDALATIDRIVLRKAIADFKRWEAKGLAVPRMSVNLSKARLRDPDLALELAKLDIDPRRLSFELLESNFLDDQSDVVAANLAAIRDLGFGIEVDDFGTGHASIVSLLRLKPDRLKIDKALVEQIATSEMQARLLRTIVDIGHMQNIAIIAEGVESAAQRELLQGMGVDELQGFALARPMMGATLESYLRDRAAQSTASSAPVVHKARFAG